MMTQGSSLIFDPEFASYLMCLFQTCVATSFQDGVHQIFSKGPFCFGEVVSVK